MSAEQCKLFGRAVSDTAIELEKEINWWLAQNPGVEIISRMVTNCAGFNSARESFVNITIAIFYKRPLP